MTLATSRPIRLRDTITAEIIKVATVPSTPIMLAVVLITNLALAVIDASKIGFYIQSDQTEPASISSFGMAMLAPVYAFLVVAAYAAASEYRDGQIRITLTAMPNRYQLFAGKTIAMLVVAFVGAALMLVPARIIIGVSNHLDI